MSFARRLRYNKQEKNTQNPCVKKKDEGMNETQKERIEPWAISRALLENVYHPVTAIVSLDAQGSILAIEMFDTLEYHVCVREAPGCEQVWLLSQHPEGRSKLYAEDVYRAMQLRARLHGKPLRVFVTGEDMGCVEVEPGEWSDVSE